MIDSSEFDVVYKYYLGSLIITRANASSIFCYINPNRHCGSSCPHFNITKASFSEKDDKITIRLSCTGCGLTIVAGRANF